MSRYLVKQFFRRVSANTKLTFRTAQSSRQQSNVRWITHSTHTLSQTQTQTQARMVMKGGQPETVVDNSWKKYDKSKVKTVIDSYSVLPEQEKAMSRLFVIDVREPEEIVSLGPWEYKDIKALNIPLSKVTGTFQAGEDEEEDSRSNEDFKMSYQVPKPRKEDQVVFTCRSGVRSARACGMLKELGYQNVANYTGGALDWFNVGQ